MLIVLASLDTVLNVTKTILGVGSLIFVHEAGHFLVGRWCGVHAEAFSIGFGPVLLKWRGKPKDPARPDQTTEYRLSAIPLGGYVKFLGENPDERGERDPRSFHAATYPRKVAIMLAGVTMNVIAAFLLFAVTFGAGWETQPPVVGQVSPGTPAWEHGVREGDEIVTIDGRRILDFMDIIQETVVAQEVEVVIRRDGAVMAPITIPTRDTGEGVRQIGVAPALWLDGRIAVGDDGIAAGAGFRTGDRVVAVNGTPVKGIDEAQNLHTAAKKDSVWTVERDGARVDLTLAWRTVPRPRIGVAFGKDGGTLLVRRGGPAADAGLATGDAVVSVGGVATPSATEFTRAVADAKVAGDAIVRRGGREIVVPLPKDEGRNAFATSIAPAPGGPIRAWLADGDVPARTAGLPDGSEIVSIDGRPITATADAVDCVRTAFKENRAVSIVWRGAGGHDGTTEVTPRDDPEPSFGGITLVSKTRVFRADGPFDAMSLAADRTGRWVGRIWGTLKSIFTGRLSGSKLAGPIGISKMTYASAKSSWGDLFLFLGMISMNLAFLNVLPLPLLDGGQLAVHTIERIRRKPIPERALEGVMWAGLVLLLALLVYVSRNDILALMQS